MKSEGLYDYQYDFFNKMSKDYFDTKKIIINNARQSGKIAISQEYNYRHSLMTATRAIQQNRDGEILVIKDRYNPRDVNEKLTNKEVVEVMSSMIVDHLFSDNMRLFEDTKKKELAEAIKKTIEKEMQL